MEIRHGGEVGAFGSIRAGLQAMISIQEEKALDHTRQLADCRDI